MSKTFKDKLTALAECMKENDLCMEIDAQYLRICDRDTLRSVCISHEAIDSDDIEIAADIVGGL